MLDEKINNPEQAAPISHAEYQEQQFDLLADGIRKALDMKAIYALMEKNS